MLKKIIDKSNLKINDLIEKGIEIDLKRIDLLKHKGRPFFTNSLKITATNGLLMDSIMYSFQYGFNLLGKFYPIGNNTGKISHECLPYLTE